MLYRHEGMPDKAGGNRSIYKNGGGGKMKGGVRVLLLRVCIG